jgi:hypothetical protein
MSGDLVGYGQQEPGDTSSDFNTTTFMVRQMIARLSITKLVQVVAVNKEKNPNPQQGEDPDVAPAGTVDVVPLVNQIDGRGNATPWATVYNVPFTRIYSGTSTQNGGTISAIIMDPQVGDIGYVVANDRDSGTVIRNLQAIIRADGQIPVAKTKSQVPTPPQGNPGSFRRFDISDGIYVGGVLDKKPNQYILFNAKGIVVYDSFKNNMVMNKDGIVILDKNNNKITMNKDGIVILDKSNNKITMDTYGIVALDKNGNQITLNANCIEVKDFNSNDMLMNASGIHMTPKTGQPLSINGSVSINGALTATANIGTTGGNVIALLGNPGQVDLLFHVHTYDRPDGVSHPFNTLFPQG